MRMRVILLPLILAVGLASISSALDTTYLEDFSTTDRLDAAYTTARWDTTAAELGLFCREMSIAGHTVSPGAPGDIAVGGHYAFVAAGEAGFHVIDISDPASPAIVGTVDTPGTVHALDIAGRNVYVADGTAGMSIYRVSGSPTPVYVSTLGGLGEVTAVLVEGANAFVFDRSNYLLRVIDIRNVASPVQIGQDFILSNLFGMAIQGDRLFYAGFGAMYAVDISDPSAPFETGECYYASYAEKVAVAGDHAFVASGAYGFFIFDVAAAEPVPIATLPLLHAKDVALDGNFAYVVGADGVTEINVSDRTNPIVLESAALPQTGLGVAVSGGRVYVADGPGGIHVLETSTFIGLDELATSEEWAWRTGVVGGNLLYGSGQTGLRILDVANPRQPQLISFTSFTYSGEFTTDIALNGHYAYVCSDYGYLRTLDVSDPAVPTIVDTDYHPSAMRGLARSGDHLYAASRDDGTIRIYDVADPAAPIETGHIGNPAVMDVAVEGNILYAASHVHGLRTWDISDPVAPVQLDLLDTPFLAAGLAIDRERVFVAERFDGVNGGIGLVESADPANTVFRSSWSHSHGSEHCLVYGNHLFYTHAAQGPGIRVLDVSDLGNPSQLATNYNRGWDGLALIGDYLMSTSGLYRVYEREFVKDQNLARSLDVHDAPDFVFKVRLETAQEGSIDWELSADGGYSWQGSVPGDGWQTLDVPGPDLRWRSVHHYRGDGIEPVCSELRIDWLYEFPVIVSVVDVPNDEGGEVELSFTRSSHDFADQPLIDNYTVWRRVDGAGGRAEMPPGVWESVGSIPAGQQDLYTTITPTLADSSASGPAWTTYCVTAHTADPEVWFPSYPDSGYSVDDIAPAAPTGLHFSGPDLLEWNAAPEPDFAHHTVYGSDNPVFDPTATLLGITEDSVYDVSGTDFDYYHVTTSDYAGNESEAASVQNSTSSAPGCAPLPTCFAFRAGRPNPFQAQASVAFDLPAAEHVELIIYDAAGRQVRVLANERYAAGQHRVTWDGMNAHGQPQAPGVYFARIRAGDFQASQRMVRIY